MHKFHKQVIATVFLPSFFFLISLAVLFYNIIVFIALIMMSIIFAVYSFSLLKIIVNDQKRERQEQVETNKNN